MIGDLVNNLKLTAMDIKSEIKDVVHDVTTKMPDTVQTDYSKLDSQNIQSSDLGYMNNGWGGMQSKMAANQIDMIAEKINFVSDIIQQGLMAFDAIEAELNNYARGTVPPQPQQLTSMAIRVDSNQKQIFMGLQKLKELSAQIDKATDTLQGNQNDSLWGSKNIGGSW